MHRLLLPFLLLLPGPALAQAFGITTMLVHSRERVMPHASSGRVFDETASEAYGLSLGLRIPVLGVIAWMRSSLDGGEGWKFYDLLEGEMLLGTQALTVSRGEASATARGQLYAATTFRLGLQVLHLEGDGYPHDYLHLRGGVQRMLSERHIYSSAVHEVENRWEPFLIVGRHRGRLGIEAGAGTGGYLMLDLRRRLESGFFWSVRAERHAQKLTGSENDGLYLFLGIGGGL